MKTKLRLQSMILCLIILPFITTAQKQFSQKKITAKKHVSVATLSESKSSVVSDEFRQQFVQKKLNQLLSLSKERKGVSPLLPKDFSGKSNVVASNEEFKVENVDVASPPPLSNFRGAKD